MPAPPDVALRAQLACARRELALRVRVYPRLTAQGKLGEETAIRELAAMRAIVQTLRTLAQAEAAGEDGRQQEMWGGTRAGTEAQG